MIDERAKAARERCCQKALYGRRNDTIGQIQRPPLSCCAGLLARLINIRDLLAESPRQRD